MARKAKVEKEIINEVENNENEVVINDSDVILEDVREFRMPLNEFVNVSLIPNIKTVYLFNLGGGDLYLVQESFTNKILIKPNEVKKLDGVDRIVLYSYSRPLVKVEQYK